MLHNYHGVSTFSTAETTHAARHQSSVGNLQLPLDTSAISYARRQHVYLKADVDWGNTDHHFNRHTDDAWPGRVVPRTCNTPPHPGNSTQPASSLNPPLQCTHIHPQASTHEPHASLLRRPPATHLEQGQATTHLTKLTQPTHREEPTHPLAHPPGAGGT